MGAEQLLIPFNAIPMMRLLRLGIFIVVAILGYNYFLGDEVEKEQSREIVGKAADLGKDAWNLLKGEKEKFQEGKYDGAVDQLKSLYGNLKEQATKIRDSGALDRLADLEKRRQELERRLETGTEAEQAEAGEALEDLTADTEDLMNDLESKGQ